MSWSQAYGLMAILTVAVAWLSHREHLQKTAIMLFASWAVSNIVREWAGLPLASYAYLALDVSVALYVFRVTVRHKSITALMVLLFFVAMGASHVWYHYLLYLGVERPYTYSLALNVLFACQLAVVTTSSGYWAVNGLRRASRLRHARGGSL